MNTAIMIVLIICITLISIVALVLVAALIASRNTQKRMDKFEKDFFKEDDNGR